MNRAPVVRIIRLLVLIGTFVLAARLIPTGGTLATTPLAGADREEDLLAAFEGAERAMVERGRNHDLVGTVAPSLSFTSFQGGTLSFDDLEKAVTLVFVDTGCELCAAVTQKVATLSVIYYEDLVAGAIATNGTSAAISQLLTDVGGTGIVLGGEDVDDAVAGRLEITRRPTLLVVGPTGTVDAVWTEDIPLNVMYRFLKVAYDFDGEDEKPNDPFEDSGLRDG